jgi:membrane associated rhomboid family serine protease
MVFPISDDNTGRTTPPIVNYVLIALNVFVFIVPQGFGSNEEFTYKFSCVPRQIVTGKSITTPDRVIIDPITEEEHTLVGLQPTPLPALRLTLITSMFLHGGLAHLLGNMLFLWIFGDNIEDALGHVRYLIFYLVCGVLAGLAHIAATYAFGADTLVPCLGASGAISGVLGGYALLFPYNRVTVFLFRILVDVPAIVAISLWFVFQLLSGLGTLGRGAKEGGVAYGAHIGGFLAGLALVKVFALGREAGAGSPRGPFGDFDTRS